MSEEIIDEAVELTPAFLVFDTEELALAKATEEGIARGYSYHINGKGTRYHSGPRKTEDEKFALDVTEYITLTEDEQANTVESVNYFIEE